MDTPVKSWIANVPQWVTLVIALFVYAAGMLAWGAKVGLRVDNLENHVVNIDQKLGKLEESDRLTSDRLLIINERQQGVLNILGDNGKKLDGVLNLLRSHDIRPKPDDASK